MFKLGDRIKVTGNSNSHSYTIGNEYTICSMYGNGYYQAASDDGTIGNQITTMDIELCLIKRKSIINDINKLKTEESLMNHILKFVKENDINGDIDLSEFASWYILNIIKDPDADYRVLSKILNTLTNNLTLETLKFQF